MKIGLVACTTKKLAGTHEAQIAYTSRTFTARVKHVKEHCDAWYILSSRYGLIEPTFLVSDYDTWIRNEPLHRRKVWQTGVLEKVLNLKPTSVTLHAGFHYFDPVLEAGLVSEGVEVLIPTRGMSICNTYSYLKECNALRENVS